MVSDFILPGQTSAVAVLLSRTCLTLLPVQVSVYTGGALLWNVRGGLLRLLCGEKRASLSLRVDVALIEASCLDRLSGMAWTSSWGIHRRSTCLGDTTPCAPGVKTIGFVHRGSSLHAPFYRRLCVGGRLGNRLLWHRLWDDPQVAMGTLTGDVLHAAHGWAEGRPHSGATRRVGHAHALFEAGDASLLLMKMMKEIVIFTPDQVTVILLVIHLQ